MKRLIIVIACLAALASLAGAAILARYLIAPPGTDVQNLPAKHIAFWQSALARPLAERIGPAPEALVEYLADDSKIMGLSNEPRAAETPADFLKDVNEAIAGMPPAVKQLVQKKLVGIYFVHDLGSTALTDYVKGEGQEHDAGFIVLDVDVLMQQRANAWATWKESTPFQLGPHAGLTARIEEPAQDNRSNAIQYILLHEFGHVVSINERIHPRWDQATMSLGSYPFAQLSWVQEKNGIGYRSRFDDAFTLRKDVVYYLGPRIPGDSMATAYTQLEQTNFPTLYAATNLGDDFAESFASYVHTVLLKKPLEIQLHRDGAVVKRYGSCWDEPRCAEKRKILDGLLGS